MSQVYDPQTTPVLDASTIQQLLDLDDGALGLLEEMVDIYRTDMPDRFRALEATLDGDSLSEVAEVAHALKGAAGTMGAPRARAVAAVMEGGSRKGELTFEHLRELAAELRASYDESLAALEAYLAERR